jgi:hypothetical protein
MMPILLGEMVQNNQRTCFLCCFLLLSFWGHLGTPKWTQKYSYKLVSGQDVCSDV